MTMEKPNYRNEPETLAPDPRKLPPWYFTGIVLCTRTKTYVTPRGVTRTYNDGSVAKTRERWENAETGEVEIRAPSYMDITDE